MPRLPQDHACSSIGIACSSRSARASLPLARRYLFAPIVKALPTLFLVPGLLLSCVADDPKQLSDPMDAGSMAPPYFSNGNYHGEGKVEQPMQPPYSFRFKTKQTADWPKLIEIFSLPGEAAWLNLIQEAPGAHWQLQALSDPPAKQPIPADATPLLAVGEVFSLKTGVLDGQWHAEITVDGKKLDLHLTVDQGFEQEEPEVRATVVNTAFLMAMTIKRD